MDDKGPRKPASIVYGIDERPPPLPAFLLGVQHAAVAMMFMAYVVVFGKEIGLSATAIAGVVSVTTLALGFGTLVQVGVRRFGCGHLIVEQPSPVFLPVAIQAGAIGGLGAVFVLAGLIGLFVVLLARLATRFRKIFPPDVCGVVVLLLGIAITEPSLDRMLMADAGTVAAGFDPEALAAGLATLALMIGLSIWGGRVKLYALMIGVVFGYGLCAALGLGGQEAARAVAEAPLLAWPHLSLPSYSFDPALVPIALLIAVVTVVDSIGVLITSQKINDENWKRADLGMVARGIQTDGAASLVGGLAGGFAVGLSSSSLGSAFATGVTSRRVGIIAGFVLIASVFSPKIPAVIAAMPDPLIGAILAYAAAFLITSGMDLILSRMMSERRVFMVGLSVMTGLSVSMAPALYAGLSPALASLIESPLVIGAVVAVTLNLLFRIGVAESARITPGPGDAGHDEAADFLIRNGQAWAARRDVVDRAIVAAHECLDAIRGNGLAEGPVTLSVRYDEFTLALEMRYAGLPLAIADTAPTPEEMIDDPGAVARLAGFLLRRYADRAELVRHPDGEVSLVLRFEQ